MRESRRVLRAARKREDMMISSTGPNMLSQVVCIRAQRRTLNEMACSLPGMSGLFLDAWPLSHYTAVKGLAQTKVKKMY